MREVKERSRVSHILALYINPFGFNYLCNSRIYNLHAKIEDSQDFPDSIRCHLSFVAFFEGKYRG